jgi:hypothetical protein
MDGEEEEIHTNTIYRSYLLRLWYEKGQPPSWRVMLENVAVPGEQQYFKDLESLMAYFSSQLVDANPPAVGEE